MSKFIFPYGVRFQENGRIEVFPAAEVFVSGQRGVGLRALFHIDSGATTSILPASDGPVLGIRVPDGKKMVVHGISGEPLTGYRHVITVEFSQPRKTKIPVIFVERVAVPRILGREGLFPQFGIVFNEAGRRTAFLDVKTERKTIDVLFGQ